MFPPLAEVGASQDITAIAAIITGLSPPARRFLLRYARPNILIPSALMFPAAFSSL